MGRVAIGVLLFACAMASAKPDYVYRAVMQALHDRNQEYAAILQNDESWRGFTADVRTWFERREIPIPPNFDEEMAYHKTVIQAQAQPDPDEPETTAPAPKSAKPPSAASPKETAPPETPVTPPVAQAKPPTEKPALPPLIDSPQKPGEEPAQPGAKPVSEDEESAGPGNIAPAANRSTEAAAAQGPFANPIVPPSDEKSTQQASSGGGETHGGGGGDSSATPDPVAAVTPKGDPPRPVGAAPAARVSAGSQVAEELSANRQRALDEAQEVIAEGAPTTPEGLARLDRAIEQLASLPEASALVAALRAESAPPPPSGDAAPKGVQGLLEAREENFIKAVSAVGARPSGLTAVSVSAPGSDETRPGPTSALEGQKRAKVAKLLRELKGLRTTEGAPHLSAQKKSKSVWKRAAEMLLRRPNLASLAGFLWSGESEEGDEADEEVDLMISLLGLAGIVLVAGAHMAYMIFPFAIVPVARKPRERADGAPSKAG